MSLSCPTRCSRAGPIHSAGPSLLCWKLRKPPGLGDNPWGTLVPAANAQRDTSSVKNKHQSIRGGTRCSSTEVLVMGPLMKKKGEGKQWGGKDLPPPRQLWTMSHQHRQPLQEGTESRWHPWICRRYQPRSLHLKFTPHGEWEPGLGMQPGHQPPASEGN